MADKQIIEVPIQTPMWEPGQDGINRLTRTWIIFFEKIAELANLAGGGGPYVRTLLLKDTTVKNDVADHVPIWQAGAMVRVIGVLRKVIVSDLKIRVNLDGTNLVTLTIPAATAIDTPVVAEAPSGQDVADLAILSWDVLASDGASDAAGIASLTVEWQ